MSSDRTPGTVARVAPFGVHASVAGKDCDLLGVVLFAVGGLLIVAGALFPTGMTLPVGGLMVMAALRRAVAPDPAGR
jgi:hypothetical protein